MPLLLPHHLPAIESLEKEHIFIPDAGRHTDYHTQPLRIVILNLMPMKITTETDLIRLLSASPLLLEISFMKLGSHVSKHTPAEHMNTFYKNFHSLEKEYYDGMIITGAPVEHLAFEEVDYWKELTGIFNWSREHVRSTMYICWAAQAGLYHFYGIPKYPLEKKMFGIFPHRKCTDTALPILRGFDSRFYVPHSRHSEIRRKDIEKHKELAILSESDESGVYMVAAREGRDLFITGHSEYAPDTLDKEYRRDLAKGLPIEIPQNYYRDNNPDKGTEVLWRSHAHLLFSNWVNYYVNASWNNIEENKK